MPADSGTRSVALRSTHNTNRRKTLQPNRRLITEAAGKRHRVRALALIAMAVCLLVATLTASAIAEGGGMAPSDTTFVMPADVETGVPFGAATPIAPLGVTDPGAAEALPHDDLDRGEAAHLLQAVFEEPLGASLGVFDGLQIEHFNSDHVAVINGGPSHNGLLQSLLPLRTETEGGVEKVVDLNLAPVGGSGLEPNNPLVDVEIPSELGDGIALPDASLELRLAGAPAERAPSVLDGTAAFFPNVATDSDFTVVPTPTGVEAFSHLRTPDAPLSQTYNLTLPPGAVLEERGDGGAEVAQDGEIVAVVQPPTAIDAEGTSVPVSLDIAGNSIVVTSAPEPGSAYPILVDPMVETYFWAQNNNQDGLGTDWVATSNSSKFEARSYGYGGAEKGLNIYSYAGTVSVGAQANWNYHVPRYYSDYTSYGVRPSSFITKMTLTNMNWWIENESAPYKSNPFVMSGLWDVVNNKHVSLAVRTGSEGQFFNAKTELSNPNENVGVKEGGVALLADNDTQSRPRHLWVGQATVEISDKDYPSFASAQGPSKWINGLTTDNTNLAEPIQFQASDAGLGVYALLAKTPKLGGGINQWEQTPGCPGNAKVPCPRVWSGGYWNYNPKLMPQGENVVEMIGKDPVWHFSDQVGLQKLVKVKVDRTQPTLAVSGTLSEQATLGDWLPAYTLKMSTTDGSEGAPQSGVAKLVVKVDGAVVDEANPGCATKNCAMNREWTMDVDNFGAGTHAVEVIATDAVGLTKVNSFNVTTHGDQTNPTVALSGSMTEQASLGATRPTYKLKASATDPGPTAERKSGVATTSVKVDGAVVDSSSPGCPAGGCSITREWSLNSNSYPVGAHSVEVKATDDAGRSTTKTVTINIARDTTPPQLSATSAFYTASEGWLEQKGYSYLATASDPNGYGVTTMRLKIDGAVVREESAACSNGGCGKFFAVGATIDMSTFAGGAHPAELIATDGAGNSTKRSWTINVDPAGNISVSEATDTLEAVEDTAPEATELTPVDGLVTEVVGEEGSNPQLILEEGELISQGTPTPSTVNINPENGFAVQTSGQNEEGVVHEATVEVTPVLVGAAATDAEITDGSAAVISNSSANVDTIIRPAYDGLMAFQAIRDASAPEKYSWEVNLGEGETLKSIDDQHAAIVWEDGTQAMLIAAQSAHGGDGKAVATSLSVSEGNVITLNVAHRVSGVVYPVVSGVGWEGGFQIHEAIIVGPKEEAEEKEIMELTEASPSIQVYADSPEVIASASSNTLGGPDMTKKWAVDICPRSLLGTSVCDAWKVHFKGFFRYNFKEAYYPDDRNPKCDPHSNLVWSVDLTECAWVGPNHQHYGNGYHITSRTQFDVTADPGVGPSITKEKAVTGRAYGSGNIYFHKTADICNPNTSC